MKISTRQVDGITVIDASGRITLGDGNVLLRDTIVELLTNGHRKLLLNLAGVSYIDSSGLGVWWVPTQMCASRVVSSNC